MPPTDGRERLVIMQAPQRTSDEDEGRRLVEEKILLVVAFAAHKARMGMISLDALSRLAGELLPPYWADFGSRTRVRAIAVRMVRAGLIRRRGDMIGPRREDKNGTHAGRNVLPPASKGNVESRLVVSAA
jgi:hypothetical protein